MLPLVLLLAVSAGPVTGPAVSPDGELARANAHAGSLPADVSPYARYWTTYAMTGELRLQAERSLPFVLNSTASVNRPSTGPGPDWRPCAAKERPVAPSA